MLEEEKRVSTRVSNGVVSFDTQRVVDRLREGGWNEGQARALCDVLREIMRGVAMSVELKRVESSLRADNKRLESSMEGKFATLEGKFATLEGKFASLEGQMASQMASLRADNKRLESSMEGKFASLEGQIASLRFMMLAGFGFLGLAMTFVGIFF